MTWEEKAEWLRTNGFALKIIALDEEATGARWMAAFADDGRCYADTITRAVEDAYKAVQGGKYTQPSPRDKEIERLEGQILYLKRQLQQARIEI